MRKMFVRGRVRGQTSSWWSNYMTPTKTPAPKSVEKREKRKIPCCVCGRIAYIETDRENRPGHYSLYRSRGACHCYKRI